MEIKKYVERHWAVYDDTGQLVCVTVYKKGAVEVVKRLESKSPTDKAAFESNEPYLDSNLIKEIHKASKNLNRLLKQLKARN